MSDTPAPVPVNPHAEPEQILASATGLVVPADGGPQSHLTGERQARENRENESPC